jgi:DNA-binding transcriptional ArsR family regulator
MADDDVAAVTTPEQFKALGHPMRHRLLFALGRGQATISQLAAALGSNKGNIAHHLKVLAEAGLVRPAGTRTVRGGTEQYYRRAARGLSFDDTATTEAAFRALAADIAAAQPEPFLMLRTLRLTPEHAKQLVASLRHLADQSDDGDAQPRYGLLLGLYQPAQVPSNPATSTTHTNGQATAGEPQAGNGALPVSAGDCKRTVAAVVVGFGVPDSVPCP